MSDTAPMPPPETEPAALKRQWLPQLRSRWWTLVLGLSLMANFLVLGLALGVGVGEQRAERIMGASYVQLIPRDFMRQLPRERRAELMGIVHERMHQLRKLRANSEASPLKLADALEKPDATEADIKAAVDAFATGSGSLAAEGGNVVLQIVGKLSPEERRVLAASIRERAERANRRRRN